MLFPLTITFQRDDSHVLEKYISNSKTAMVVENDLHLKGAEREFTITSFLNSKKGRSGA